VSTMKQISLVLLKPDCLSRGLEDQVIAMLKERAKIVAQKRMHVHEEMILSHYADLISRRGEQAKQQLCEIYVHREVIVLLLYGDMVVTRIRSLIGSPDPAKATSDTIRGRFANDSYQLADREGRLVNNVIHASLSPKEARRECQIWFPTEHPDCSEMHPANR
jgi:nucleoside-diphosphate kinase